MADQAVVTEPVKEEEKKDLPAGRQDKTIGQEIREKSFQQLLREQQDARRDAAKDSSPQETPQSEVPDTAVKEEDDKAAKEAEEAKRLVEAEESEKKRQEELASKAAEEVVKKQQQEEQQKADQLKAEEAEKERQKSLQPKWKTDPNAPKDKDGNPVPRSYDELQAESVRIAKEEAKLEFRAELEAKERAKAEEAQKTAQAEKQRKDAQTAYETTLQKQMDEDLKDIYTAGDLPRIKNKDDEKDPGNLEFRNLFETAQRVNAERLKAGKAPISSVKLIRYGKDELGQPYYKPLSKPAGHDAPVMGKESTISKGAPEDKYIPSRDRKKSMGQLIREEAARAARKLNVRGV